MGEKEIQDKDQYYYHDPQCELFPTEVACTFRVGATTGGIDRSNFLCILGNNLFNQKYFLFLWMWWVFLLVVSGLGVIYRIAYAMIPSFARSRLLRKIHSKGVDNFNLYKFTTSYCFVLDLVLDNIKDPRQKREVLEQINNLLNEELKDEEESKGGKRTWLNLDGVGKPYTESCQHSEVSLTESDAIAQAQLNHAKTLEVKLPNGNIPNGNVHNGTYPTLPK